VKLIGVCKEPQFAIVLEYMEHGSLEKLVFNHEIKLEYDLLVGIARDVAAGVNYQILKKNQFLTCFFQILDLSLTFRKNYSSRYCL
jgi:serine/threonine protein kinase